MHSLLIPLRQQNLITCMPCSNRCGDNDYVGAPLTQPQYCDCHGTTHPQELTAKAALLTQLQHAHSRIHTLQRAVARADARARHAQHELVSTKEHSDKLLTMLAAVHAQTHARDCGMAGVGSRYHAALTHQLMVCMGGGGVCVLYTPTHSLTLTHTHSHSLTLTHTHSHQPTLSQVERTARMALETAALHDVASHPKHTPPACWQTMAVLKQVQSNFSAVMM